MEYVSTQRKEVDVKRNCDNGKINSGSVFISQSKVSGPLYHKLDNDFICKNPTPLNR